LDRILGLDMETLISVGFHLINFLIFTAVMAKLLYNPVLNYMRKRAERIAEQLKNAAENEKSAQTLKDDYESKLRAFESGREQLMEESRKKALEKQDQIILEARREAESIKTRAYQDIEREQEKAKDEVRKQIIEVSSLMTERFVRMRMDPQTQNQLFDEIMADLGDA